jgi:hypothetical protein
LAKIDLFLNRALLGEELQTVFNKLKKKQSKILRGEGPGNDP